MGFQGQLSSVNLGDIFQTLAMNRQTGTLHVTSPSATVLVHFDLGQIIASSAPLVDDRPFLLHALGRKGFLASEQIDELVQRLRTVAQPLRALLIASAYIPESDLDTVCAWCIEEMVCPVFTWSEGEFSFVDGPIPAELQGPDAVEMGGSGLAPTQVILEATRRRDEWKRIREIITDEHALYIIDNAGRPNLKNVQTDPDMLKVVRYLDGRHLLSDIARQVGVTQFDTYAIVAQLVVAQVARPLSAQEMVDDAERLRKEGDPGRAKELLEIALLQTRVPEILRPLAECCAATQQAPRAVEIYLELIQMARDSGELEQALADLDTVIALSPDDPELHSDRGQILADLNRGDDGSAAYCSAAQAYLLVKDIANAIDACHRAKNLVPRAPDPHRFLAKAYLMDGQTENAVVEYKALWHALLTVHSPRRALDELRLILTGDCKFQAVKDQVLAHAQNSEAVKTGRVVRMVLVSGMAAALLVGGFYAWTMIQDRYRITDGHNQINKVRATYTESRAQMPHTELIRKLDAIRIEFQTSHEIESEAARLRSEISKDFDDRAQATLLQAKSALDAGRFDEARRIVQRLKVDFPNAAAASEAGALDIAISRAIIDVQVGSEIREAKRLWSIDEWDAAVARLQPLLTRRDVPTDIAKDLQAANLQWTAAITSAEALVERAERIAGKGDLAQARAAFQRASQGTGNAASITQARSRLGDIERTIAERMATAIAEAAGSGKDQDAFATLDKLNALSRESGNPQVRDIVMQLPLPFHIAIDHPATVITINRSRGGETLGAGEQVRAPAGSAGRWSHRLTYTPSETVTITAVRTGFTAQPLLITAQQRRSSAVLSLARGALWRHEVGSIASTPPTTISGAVLYGTNRSSVLLLDPSSGSERSIALEDAVSSLSQPPLMYDARIYVAHEERISAYEMANRARRWSWPDGAQPALRFDGLIATDRSELIQDRLLVFAGTTDGQLIILGVDPRERVTAYPRVPLGQRLTAMPVVERSGDSALMALSIATELRLYDIATVTESIPPSLVQTLRVRGDLVGRPTRLIRNDRPLWLFSDASGQVTALDLGKDPVANRVAGQWPVDGAPSGYVALSADSSTAYATTSEGRLVALDMTRPGKMRWRYPLTGTVSGMSSMATVGSKAIYVADAVGQLHAVDPATGQLRWRADLGAPASAPASFVEGRILVPLRNGQLVCFEEGDE